jgi:hypothetical protein
VAVTCPIVDELAIFNDQLGLRIIGAEYSILIATEDAATNG